MSSQFDSPSAVANGFSMPVSLAPDGIVAVVVTYNPDVVTIRAQTSSLRDQLVRIVWVDNGSSFALDGLAGELGVQLLKMGANEGVAAAQNAGMKLAHEQGASFVMLMDHDSIPGPGMVQRLHAVMASHPEVAAVGPYYTDPRSGEPSHPFVWIDGLRLQRLARPVDGAISSEVDHLIASGCLIRTTAWRDIGPMLTPMFIDFVDVEWCLRARSKGWHLHGVWDAHMSHTIGHAVVRRMGKNFRIHSPTRHYFHVRNGVFLYRQNWIAVNWRLVSFWRMILKTGFYFVFSHSRLSYIRSTLRGIVDGVQFNPVSRM
jgi:rhamnosyltransferase